MSSCPITWGAKPELVSLLIAIAGAGTMGLVLALWFGSWLARLRGPVERAEALVGRRQAGGLVERAAAVITALEQACRLSGPRAQTHAISGLPTREPLILRMKADGEGTLGLIAIKDYDRLCAFDPELAERLLLVMVDRLAAMIPSAHLLAQIDRTHLAIWIGPEVELAAAAIEVGALAYALGDRWCVGDREILPEIAFRTGRLRHELGAPEALLSQTLSSFSVPLITDVRETIASIDPGVQSRERFQVEQDLRQALGRDELHMQFQPLVDAAGAHVFGAEALLRWCHPERGLISPARFIPIMEAADLSQEIGMWALNRAVREVRRWRVEGHDLRVAVNVSGRQLEGTDLPVLIERTLARHELGGEALEIELTESVALAEGDSAPRLSEALRSKGIRIAIDDFGTGYSSFAALNAIGFDKIKIDRAFVTGVHSRRESQAICSSILTLGRGLGINVLAEGVEAADEFVWLRNHGCRFFQGFYFAPPLSSEAFLDFVRDGQALNRLLQLGEQDFSEKVRA